MAEVYFKSKNRLTFKTNLIESLKNNDFYINEIESLGIFKISKADFYKYFPKVVETDSYKSGNYNYPSFPKEAEKFLIRKNLDSNKISEEESKMSKAEELTKLLENTHNLILHGAPGTGKTHLARDIADDMGAEVGFVQFHPSYDYTDFVEGLRPVNDGNGGQIGFERKDGVFKKFCERALKKSVIYFLYSAYSENRYIKAYRENEDNYKDNYSFSISNINTKDDFITILPIGNNHGTQLPEINLKISYLNFLTCSHAIIDSKEDIKGIFQDIPEYSELYYFTILNEIKKSGYKPFIFIIDEINRGEMSKIFGELFFAIEPSYRGAEKCKDLRTQYANLQIDQNYFDTVLGIKEKDNFGHFFIPENVYIIGTMNDIDRNVESMDFAFRRRFTFKEIKAKDTQMQILSSLDDSIQEEAIARMDSLNDAISKIDGLSSAYHIGGAYFLKLKELDNDFVQLWDYHLEGLLREYLRGMEDSESKLDDLKKAYNQEA